MDLLTIIILILLLLVLRCPILEGIGIIYSLFLCSWADIILEQHSEYGTIAITKTYIGQKILLTNDAVIHSIHGDADGIPAGYCHPGSGVAEALLQIDIAPHNAKITLIGMGCGATLYYAKAGQLWTCYEINPALIQLATANQLFKFHASCPIKPLIYCTDGFTATTQLQQQDVIIVDTFFGDTNVAYPEIVANLVKAMTMQTVLILHVSGLPKKDVARIVETAALQGLTTLSKATPILGRKIWICSWHDFEYPFYMPATWLIICRDRQRLANLALFSGWKVLA